MNLGYVDSTSSGMEAASKRRRVHRSGGQHGEEANKPPAAQTPRTRKLPRTKVTNTTIIAHIAALSSSNSAAEVLDQFTYGEFLGAGHFGVVLRGSTKHPDNPKDVAIKIMKVSEKPKANLQIFTEIKCLKMMEHANIPKYIDSCVLDADILLIMEYVDGLTWADLARSVTMSPPQIATVCHDVLQAISFLHARKYIHRDVKPDNVMVSRTGSVKLCDLGLCVHEKVKRGRAGTRRYMAPEVSRRPDYTTKVDIWSLGASMTYMLQRIHDNSDLKELPALCPRLQTDFVDRCMVEDAEERASASQLLEHQYVRERATSEELAAAVVTAISVRSSAAADTATAAKKTAAAAKKAADTAAAAKKTAAADSAATLKEQVSTPRFRLVARRRIFPDLVGNVDMIVNSPR